jgi:UrcA family protein
MQSAANQCISILTSRAEAKNGRIEMLTRLSKTAAVLSGVTASLMIATPVLAQGRPVVGYGQPDEYVPTERVHFADLNLATRGGEKMLQARVSNAVDRVCQYNGGGIGLVDNGYVNCAFGAWKDARPKMALAIARARDIALNGRSSIAATAITISAR